MSKISVDEVLLAYEKAAQKFIDKVESGQAQSVVTYRELKEAQRLAQMYRAQED